MSRYADLNARLTVRHNCESLGSRLQSTGARSSKKAALGRNESIAVHQDSLQRAPAVRASSTVPCHPSSPVPPAPCEYVGIGVGAGASDPVPETAVHFSFDTDAERAVRLPIPETIVQKRYIEGEGLKGGASQEPMLPWVRNAAYVMSPAVTFERQLGLIGETRGDDAEDRSTAQNSGTACYRFVGKLCSFVVGTGDVSAAADRESHNNQENPTTVGGGALEYLTVSLPVAFASIAGLLPAFFYWLSQPEGTSYLETLATVMAPLQVVLQWPVSVAAVAGQWLLVLPKGVGYGVGYLGGGFYSLFEAPKDS